MEVFGYLSPFTRCGVMRFIEDHEVFGVRVDGVLLEVSAEALHHRDGEVLVSVIELVLPDGADFVRVVQVGVALLRLVQELLAGNNEQYAVERLSDGYSQVRFSRSGWQDAHLRGVVPLQVLEDSLVSCFLVRPQVTGWCRHGRQSG